MIFHIRVWVSLFLACGLLSGSTSAAEHGPQTSRPNIVFILADDLGWTDLGCQGSQFYETPHIDRLAREGLTFESFYVCQNCAPTRAALMSGQYAPRTGVYSVGTLARGKAADRHMVPPENVTKLPLGLVTVANALREAGYATGLFGKWHLGRDPQHHPAARGFDEAIVSAGRHFRFKTVPERDVPEGAYLADYLTSLAVDFLERHQEEPFFLYLPHFAVHNPLQAKPELIEKYREKPPAGGHKHPDYAAMIDSVDESVGRVLAKLDELGLADNTVVIFSSDNGGLGGYTVPGTDRRKGTTDNAPLRGGKGTLHEGGVRVPFIVRWPAVTSPGSRTQEPGVHVDFFPTCLELAGAAPPVGQTLDGVSLLPLFRDPTSRLTPRAIYWHFPGYLESYIPEATWRTTPVAVIRDGPYKLLEFLEEPRVELYDLGADIGETHNLAQELPDVAELLKGKLHRWQTASGALMPEPIEGR